MCKLKGQRKGLVLFLKALYCFYYTEKKSFN